MHTGSGIWANISPQWSTFFPSLVFLCSIQWIPYAEVTGLSLPRLVLDLSLSLPPWARCSWIWWCLQIWQIPEINKSGAELKQSSAQKSSVGATPKVVAFSPLEAAIAKPRSSPLTIESSKVRRSEIATQVTFYMIPALLLVSKNSISTSLLVGAVFHQVYMFHKEILLDYVHHDITRKWSLIYFKLLLLVMAKDTIMYFNLF